jgi:hypothetical protein
LKYLACPRFLHRENKVLHLQKFTTAPSLVFPGCLTPFLSLDGHMLSACSGVHQDVINIHYYTLPVQVPENLVYKGLED